MEKASGELGRAMAKEAHRMAPEQEYHKSRKTDEIRSRARVGLQSKAWVHCRESKNSTRRKEKAKEKERAKEQKTNYSKSVEDELSVGC